MGGRVEHHGCGGLLAAPRCGRFNWGALRRRPLASTFLRAPEWQTRLGKLCGRVGFRTDEGAREHAAGAGGMGGRPEATEHG